MSLIFFTNPYIRDQWTAGTAHVDAAEHFNVRRKFVTREEFMIIKTYQHSVLNVPLFVRKGLLKISEVKRSSLSSSLLLVKSSVRYS